MKKSELLDYLLVLISEETLLRRIEILQEQIKECEEEIPYNFWCDECKKKMNKVKSLFRKIHARNNGYLTEEEPVNGNTFTGTTATAVDKFRCSKCKRGYGYCIPTKCLCGSEDFEFIN